MSIIRQVDIGLSAEVIGLLKSVFVDQSKVRRVLIFGSRAKGNYREGSDIDLAIVADGFTFDDMIQLQLEIDDLDLLYKVDCVDYDKIDNQELTDHINRVGKILYPY